MKFANHFKEKSALGNFLWAKGIKFYLDVFVKNKICLVSNWLHSAQ